MLLPSCLLHVTGCHGGVAVWWPVHFAKILTFPFLWHRESLPNLTMPSCHRPSDWLGLWVCMYLSSTSTIAIYNSNSELQHSSKLIQRSGFIADVCEWVWTGAEFNIQLYNALLRVKLENEAAFSPAEVLSDIEVQRQLVPNRVGFFYRNCYIRTCWSLFCIV